MGATGTAHRDGAVVGTDRADPCTPRVDTAPLADPGQGVLAGQLDLLHGRPPDRLHLPPRHRARAAGAPVGNVGRTQPRRRPPSGSRRGSRTGSGQVFSWSPGRGGPPLRALRDRAPLPPAASGAPRQQPARSSRHGARDLPPLRAAPDLEDAGVVQQKADARVPASAFERRAARFADDLERLVNQIHLHRQPTGAAARDPASRGALDHLVPRHRRADRDDQRGARRGRHRGSTATTCGSSTPARRWPRWSRPEHDIVPDGGHYTAEAHDAIGRADGAGRSVPWCDANVPL